MSLGALYFPYIRPRDDAWLKKAALIWPSISRIVPPSRIHGQGPPAACARPALRARHCVQPFRAPPTTTPRTCQDCGAVLSSDVKRCGACHQAANAQRLREQQVDETARRRATSGHPSQRPEVRARIADAQRAQWAARRGDHSAGGFTGTPSEFRRLILPRLVGLAPRQLASETGLSRGYCAQVRDGKRVPDVRHWAAFQLAGLGTRQ
jgi:hypothetical protein